MILFFFFFNDTATTEIYTLSLHDALPIYSIRSSSMIRSRAWSRSLSLVSPKTRDRKSTRLNSSHSQISYAVFCLKKKKIRSEVHSVILIQQSAQRFIDVTGGRGGGVESV